MLKQGLAGPPTVAEYRRHAQRGALQRGGEVTEAPVVSVVTVALNAGATLARTIESVQQQSFASIEHVVIDGGSSDGTRALLRASLRLQDYWISESDRGISDALNKGVALARGRYIQFIHADDWLSPTQIEHAVDTLERADADFVFGDLVFYESGVPVFRYAGDPEYGRIIRRGMPALNHPTVLARRACFERIGLFDLRYRCAMDYDWFLRLHLAGGRGVHDPRVRGHMNHDGVSNTDFHRTIREVSAIAVAHGCPPARAHLDAAFQHAKMAIGRWIKARARPVYHTVRKSINRSYRHLT